MSIKQAQKILNNDGIMWEVQKVLSAPNTGKYKRYIFECSFTRPDGTGFDGKIFYDEKIGIIRIAEV